MSRSWGHRVAPLSADTRKRDDEYLAGIRTVLTDVPCPNVPACEVTLRRRATGGWTEEQLARDDHYHREWRDGEPRPEYTHCSRRCPNRREFEVSYRYVTGRAGRTSEQTRTVCRQHALAFAKKNSLDLATICALTRTT